MLPTIFAGSGATPILGHTEGGRKTTLTDRRVQPEMIFYDAELVSSLAVSIAVASGLNATDRAGEGLYARDRNPVATLLASEGMRAVRTALPRVRWHVMPVTRADGAPVGDGRPGPVTKALDALYWRRHDEGWKCTFIWSDA